MLDLKEIRDNPDRIRAGARKKRLERAAEIDRLLAVDGQVRELMPRIEEMRARQKAAGKSLGGLTPDQRSQVLAEQKKLKEELVALEAQEKELKTELDRLLLLIPNVPAPEVPEGLTSDDNVEIQRVGEPPRFAFTPRSHTELGEALGWFEFERAGQIAGTRNYFLKGDGALLHDAVMRLALDHMVQKGFVAFDPPLLVRAPAMVGTAYFPGGEEQAYRVDKDDLYLIGTAEVPVTSYHAGEILDEAELPKRYVGRSMCFRREAGTYGKDTKGLYRVHQFQKVEQVIVDIADEERSKQHHQTILRNAEEVLARLELPYRVVNVCGGDLGAPQVQKFDVECWMPSRNGWGETHSASRFHDFQSRRLNLRYRASADKKVRFCHTLNNTVLASPRILIPLIEIHQQADGSIHIPAALRPYLGGRERLGR